MRRFSLLLLFAAVLACAWVIREAWMPDRYFAEDGATTPYYGNANYPSALYVAATETTWFVRETYVFSTTGQLSGRGVRITSFDHDAGEWGEDYAIAEHSLDDNDHGTPSLARDADGYLHVFFGAHNTDLLEYVSNSPDDPSAFTLRATHSGQYSHQHPVLVGSTLYLFLRKRDTFTPKFTWVYKKTTALVGGVPTWASDKSLIDFGPDDGFFIGGLGVDGTDIHLVGCKSTYTDAKREHVYHFILDTTTGDLTNMGGGTTVPPGSQPLGETPANASFRVVNTGGDYGGIPGLLLVGGTPHVVYPRGTIEEAMSVYYTYYSGGWQTPEDTGSDVTRRSNANDPVALAPLSAGELALYAPEDSAQNWNRGGNMTRRVRSSGGVWGSAETVLTAAEYPLSHPTTVLNGVEELGVVFAEVVEATGGVVDGDGGDLRLYTHGSGGFKWRTPYLTRASSGLLARHQSGSYGRTAFPFNTGDWSGPGSLAVVNGALVLTPPSAGVYTYRQRTSVIDRTKSLVHVAWTCSDGDQGAAVGHLRDPDAGAFDLVHGLLVENPTDFLSVREKINGANGAGASNNLVTQMVSGQTYGVSLWCDEGTAIGYTFLDGISASISPGTVQDGGVGLGGLINVGGNTLTFPRFIAMADGYVSVSGLSAGQKAAVRAWDGAVLAQATESGGTAVIDVRSVAPTAVSDIVVLESDGTTLAGLRAQAGDGIIYGGDTWELSVVPDSPTAAFSGTTEGFDVDVDASASTGTGLTYDWDWGDGSAHGSGVTAQHTYEPGTYTITLTVTDQYENTAQATATVTVGGYEEPPAPGPTVFDEGPAAGPSVWASCPAPGASTWTCDAPGGVAWSSD